MTDGSTSWTETDSATYRGIARYAVPDRERQTVIITALVAASDADGAVLDLCCGEGLLTHAIMTALPGAALLAYDGSETMLAEARAGAPDPARLTTKQIDLASEDWRQFSRPLRAVVSSLAIHHLDTDEKRALFADLYRALAPGGVLVIADLMEPANAAGKCVSAELWDEETRRRALALDGTLDGFHAFEREDWNLFRQQNPNHVDKPSSLAEHLDRLRDAGFREVDVHWMVAGHAIISGWRR